MTAWNRASRKITMQQKVTAKIGGNEISIETGKIARLADGAVIVTCGDTTVLVSAVSALAAISNAKAVLRRRKRSPRE